MKYVDFDKELLRKRPLAYVSVFRCRSKMSDYGKSEYQYWFNTWNTYEYSVKMTILVAILIQCRFGDLNLTWNGLFSQFINKILK